jgi:hypothetical protein
MNHTDLITQAQLDRVAAHIAQMKLDRDAYRLDLKMAGRIDGEIIKCTAELDILTEQFKAQAFVVRVDGVGVITPVCSYYEAIAAAAEFGGTIEPRSQS